MIDLRPNCICQLKMNDNTDTPWVAGLNGVPTELVQNGKFDDDSIWVWPGGSGWSWISALGGVAQFELGTAGTFWQYRPEFVSGEKYLIIFTILAEGSAGTNCTPKIGNAAGTTRTALGTYAEVITCAGSDGDENWLQFRGSNAAFDLDNVFCICLDDYPLISVLLPDFTSDHSVAGKINRALYLDGVYDYIKVFDKGALNFTTLPFSIAIWVKRDRSGVAEYFLTRGKYKTDGWWLALASTDKIYFQTHTSGATDYIESNETITDTNWHLIIVIKDGANSKLFLDNEEVASGLLYNPASSTRTLKIGCKDLLGFKFQGSLDGIGFTNKALSSAERDMVWHGGKGTERLISLHHHIYRGQDGKIDYSSPAAEMALDDSQVTIPGQALPANTIWHYIRRQIDDECGLESDDSPACIVAIDSNGDMIGSTPNPPISLTIERLSNGRFRLRWRYTKLSEEITPTGFKIYMDSGSGFNFSLPDATIAYGIGGINNEFSWISGALTHGQIYRFCVRSYRTGKGESQNTDYAATDADSEGPAAITDLQVSYEEI